MLCADVVCCAAADVGGFGVTTERSQRALLARAFIRAERASRVAGRSRVAITARDRRRARPPRSRLAAARAVAAAANRHRPSWLADGDVARRAVFAERALCGRPRRAASSFGC